jgi:choline monooxygenase
VFEVDPDISRARTLPPEAFVDPAHLRRELATLFRSSWLLVPERASAELRDDPRSLSDLVSRRGARAPFSLLDAPLFLSRDWDGTLRAFPNVCTHAWHTLVQGPDRQRTLTCPQHGRQFDAQGKCLSQPGFDGGAGFPGDEDHLRAFEVAEWNGLLFACLGAPAVPFEKAIAPVSASLARMPLDRLKRRPMAGEARELDGNWKQHAWNYMDRFHIPFIHRKPGGLADAIELSSYATELHGECALQWAYAKDPAHGFDPAMLPDRFHDPAGKRVFALWWLVFPNLALNFYPWGLSINAYMPVPDKPRRTLFLWYHHVMDEEKYAQRETIWMNTDVDLEDVDAMTQVGRGVASGFAAPGRFAPREEEGPHWLHRRVWERTASGGKAPPDKPRDSEAA